ncbi:very long chain fatty acid elongase AAEL008004-like [Ornithodoros turicata]|uniref:very long chain fatty acid elongase AAEL008004-like n=1 Tax=Ornithodoros turicata TaxID=34597 RepID=UPI0031392B5E
MSNPIGILSLIAFYLLFSLKLGPAFMRNRRPFNITFLVVVYNAAMVAFSIYFIFLTVKWAYVKSGYNIVCQENDSQTNPAASIIIYHGWWYLMLKVSELLDTVFFVFKKKFTHVSFLHLLHHSLALWTVWLDLHLAITGQVALFPLLNASVHVVMYTYYGLAALRLQKYLWWKKYVTQFQIAQFATLTVHSAIPLFVNCGFPRSFALLMVLEATLFMGLFSDFYYRTYVQSNVGRKVE